MKIKRIFITIAIFAKEKAEPGIRRYQKRRNSYEQRYRMRREAIRNNRIRNDDNDL